MADILIQSEPENIQEIPEPVSEGALFPQNHSEPVLIEKKRSLSTLALVCSFLALVSLGLSFFKNNIFYSVTFLLSLIGIVLAVVVWKRKRGSEKVAMAALVISALALLSTGLIYMLRIRG